MIRLHKILIANRGEIALRIQRAAKKLGISTVAVFAEGEEYAPHVLKADESVSLGSGSLADTYLNIPKIISAAKKTGAAAIHPGYGFLSESALLAEACLDNGIRFIGPSPEVLRLMGNKPEAKALAGSLGIPVLKNHPVTPETVRQVVSSIDFPVIIKSAFGGGGKGMKAIYSADGMEEQISKASRMAESYFGNGTVYLEPYIEKARHIEVQILGDDHGNLVHLFERDCTVQRNYQKIIEEAPAPGLNIETRQTLLDAALKLCGHVGYSGAGTVEFLVDNKDRFYFMEMNPRVQVEHPVSEEITGIDIVAEQLRIAAGLPLSFSQEEVVPNGHSIEVRIYSEDPFNNFTPSAAPVVFFRLPAGPGIRIETDLSENNSAGSQFDPLLCKIITTGRTRQEALQRMGKALDETIIEGPATNQPFLKILTGSKEVIHNETDTRFCENNMPALLAEIRQKKEALPDESIIAAFLFLHFLPRDPQSANPWLRLGSRNVLRRVEIRLGDELHKVPFQVLPAEKVMATTGFSWHDLNPGWFGTTFSPFVSGTGRGSISPLASARYSHSRLFSGNGPEMGSHAIPVEFSWNGKSVFALVRRQSQNSVMVLSEKNIKEIFFAENLSGKIVLYWNGNGYEPESPDLPDYYPVDADISGTKEGGGDNRVISPLHGKVVLVPVEPGQAVTKGDLLMVIESMKSENHITSHRSGRIKSVEVQAGTQVNDRMTLVVLEDEPL